jgi:hypothetical protein
MTFCVPSTLTRHASWPAQQCDHGRCMENGIDAPADALHVGGVGYVAAYYRQLGVFEVECGAIHQRSNPATALQ